GDHCSHRIAGLLLRVWTSARLPMGSELRQMSTFYVNQDDYRSIVTYIQMQLSFDGFSFFRPGSD
ncbi:hypothetical protein ACWIDJ_12500, partial [Brevundimonas naejangsanensis]